MKVALIGASGKIGSRILAELLTRGHVVTGIARNPEKADTQHANLSWQKADVLDTTALSTVIAGHDAVISAFGVDWTKPETFGVFSEVVKSILAATKAAGVKRIINVGGAGSLEVAPGVQAVDTDSFPAEWKLGAMAQRDSLEVYRKETELDWTFFSPAFLIEPGAYTGKYRLGTDNPVFDEHGHSHIGYDDYAHALVNELDNPQFIRKRFTIGY